MAAVAVYVLPTEPIWKRVSGVTSTLLSTSAIPKTACSSSPFIRMPRAVPGTPCSAIALLTASATARNCGDVFSSTVVGISAASDQGPAGGAWFAANVVRYGARAVAAAAAARK
jgi:hypothetical protein